MLHPSAISCLVIPCMEAVLVNSSFDVVSLLLLLKRDGVDFTSCLGFFNLVPIEVSPNCCIIVFLQLDFPLVSFCGDGNDDLIS